jgi:hypothetical protein
MIGSGLFVARPITANARSDQLTLQRGGARYRAALWINCLNRLRPLWTRHGSRRPDSVNESEIVLTC